ncbi:unnamed protein product [Allacma fusca]|uniref:Uncharacterized protein n=1 Tax=Allacma fusca TaxID=39272 RepID=A0A8J2NS90_9HEXA|nr:unnamed protein product [Allacma fusca]
MWGRKLGRVRLGSSKVYNIQTSNIKPPLKLLQKECYLEALFYIAQVLPHQAVVPGTSLEDLSVTIF